MPKDTPSADRDVKERGLHAQHGDDPTLKSYLSSLFYVLSFPALVLLAYAGYWWGLYPYRYIIPVFGGSLVAVIVLAFGLIQVTTAGR